MKKLLIYLSLLLVSYNIFPSEKLRHPNIGPGVPLTFSMKCFFVNIWKSIYYNFYSGVQAKKIAVLAHKEYQTGILQREINNIFPYLDDDLGKKVGPLIAQARQCSPGSQKRLSIVEEIAGVVNYNIGIKTFFTKVFGKK